MADASAPTPPALQRLGGTLPLRRYVAGVWERRAFAWDTAQSELRSQHMDSVLGNAWHLLNPLMLVGVYYLVFGVVLQTDRGVGEEFLPFLAIGIFHYQWSQKSVIGGARSITSNEGLIRSLQFPRALLPVATVLREAMAFAPAMAVMLLIVVLNGRLPSWSWLLLAPLVVLQALFNLGAAFVAARLTDRFRDIENVLPYLFRLGFYGSGVIFAIDGYLEDRAPELLPWFTINPFYSVLSLARDQLLVYTPAHAPLMWVSITVWSLVGVVVGLMVFRGGEREYGRG